MKRRIAIWVIGGIGDGDFSQGYPMLEKIVERLCDNFEVIVYSNHPPNADYQNDRIPLKFPPRFIKSGKIGWLYLLYLFLLDNQKKRFDCVITFWGYPAGFFAALITKVFGIPSIVNVLGADSSGIESINYGIFHRRFPRAIANWSYTNCTVLLAVSEFQANRLKYFGITRDICTIPWGADASMYPFAEKQKSEVLQVIHVGHINPVKDQCTLLRAFAIIRRNRPAKLKIFGTDTMRGAIHRFCNELEIQEDVEFYNIVLYNEMPGHYEQADVMLHSSLSEAQCMALTEAAACGVLMAGTRVGILHDLGNEYGVVVDVGDHEGLANGVLSCIDNPEECRRRIENARVWSEQHDLEWTVKQLSTLLQDI
ncbi:MAG: glycosyltransferase family 4 protein [Bacteroidia bacterium]|nr:glycosyltransferase family 4 protein [Bacteroidia bacterium]